MTRLATVVLVLALVADVAFGAWAVADALSRIADIPTFVTEGVL
jgi:hypothetical protein